MNSEYSPNKQLPETVEPTASADLPKIEIRRYGEFTEHSEKVADLCQLSSPTAWRNADSRSRRAKPKITPLIVYIAAALMTDLAIFYLLTSFLPRLAGELFFGAAIGFVFGQIGFFTLVAGLGSMRWIRGYLIGMLLTFAGYFCLFGGSQFTTQMISPSISDSFWSIAVIPLAILATSTPFWISRLLVGWHLTRREADLPRLQFSINDYLTMTAVIGSLILFARVPQTYWQFPSAYYWPVVASVSIGFAILGLVIYFPAAMLSMAFKSRTRTLVAQFCFLSGLCLLVFLLNLVSYISFRDLLPIFISVASGCATMFLGTIALRGSGFRLARAGKRTQADAANREQNAAHNESPWSDQEFAKEESTKAASDQDAKLHETPDPPKTQLGFWDSNRGARICAATILAVATVGSFSNYALHRQRMAKIGALSNRASAIYMDGGTIEADSRTQSITNVVLPPSAGESDLLSITSTPSVTYLDISKCNIGDSSIETIIGLGPIMELDISGTKFTANGILQLLRSLPLGRLKMADMNIPKQQLVSLLQNPEFRSLMHLDISDNGLRSTDLDLLWRNLPWTISIRGCGLNDAELSRLIKQRSPNELDVRNNRLTGAFLSSMTSIQKLELDDNPLVDASFAAVAGKLSVRQLSIGNSQLTTGIFAILPRISVRELTLSDGAFDESSLTNIPGSYSKLSLKGKRYTGTCLGAFGAGTYQIDLSRSGVTLEGLRTLAGRSVSILDLSETEIGDDALPVLGQIGSLFQLDLSHTNITADGLCRGDLSNVSEVTVAWGQFSADEILRISRIVKLRFAGDTGWP
ncbi:MAG: hypothetical protein ACE361_03250 [Aureliella sp.]